MSRPRAVRTPMRDAEALDRWFIDAESAVAYGHTLTRSIILALSARPEREGGVDDGDTWYREEFRRLERADASSPPPRIGAAESWDAWRASREQRRAEADWRLNQHTECVALAHAFVQHRAPLAVRRLLPGYKPTESAARRRAIDYSFDALIAGEDAA